MEIITYVREGVITHWDSLGNLGQTRAGDVQVMSTGTGIRHAEYNLEHTTARVFQIWIAPDRSGGTPACMRPPSAMKCSSPSPALSSSKADAMAPVPMSDGSRERYTAVAIALHWVMALGILALAAIGLLMVHTKLSLHRKFELYQLHKSIGVTVLLAAFLRLGWRLTHRPPEAACSYAAGRKIGGARRSLDAVLFLVRSAAHRLGVGVGIPVECANASVRTDPVATPTGALDTL
jgi:hypothetical protein